MPAPMHDRDDHDLLRFLALVEEHAVGKATQEGSTGPTPHHWIQRRRALDACQHGLDGTQELRA